MEIIAATGCTPRQYERAAERFGSAKALKVLTDRLLSTERRLADLERAMLELRIVERSSPISRMEPGWSLADRMAEGRIRS
jgi:predicted Zn-dependent peptidase